MVRVLDCSIRDGGHLNQWNFDPDLVQKTYHAAGTSQIHAFEVGYRFSSVIKGMGVFGYCEDALLSKVLNRKEKVLLTVMIDSNKAEVGLFTEKKFSPIDMVRVAAYPADLETALQQVEALKEKGYKVCLNPMASPELTEGHFRLLKEWGNKDILEAIYVADSFGTYDPFDVKREVTRFGDLGFEKIGFHAHNNLQLAMANTLAAIDCGVDWVDATVFGIGRGAGNAPMEILLGLLNRRGRNFNEIPYLNLGHEHYQKLCRELKCYPRSETIMGGLKNVHPYYLDELFSTDKNALEIWALLDKVKKECPVSYSKYALQELLSKESECR